MAWQVLPSATAKLSDREAEVLTLVVSGQSSREIGETLGISSRTVEVYRERLGLKLKARNTAELVRIAITGE